MNDFLDDYEPYEEPARRPRPVKRRKKKKKRGAGALPVLILLLPVIAALCCLCVLLYRRIPQPATLLPGIWEREEDVSPTVRENARSWIDGAAMGYQVRLSDRIGHLPVGISLSLQGTDYSIRVDDSSYIDAETTARKALADAVLELIGIRIKASGKELPEGLDVNGLFQEALSLTPEEYLKLHGPELMPPLTDLKDRYEDSGRFHTEEEILSFEDGSSFSYAVNEHLLILDAGKLPGADTPATQYIYSRVSSGDTVTSPSGRLPLVLTAHAAKNHKIVENLPARVKNGGESLTVKSINYEYSNNRYLSLRDLAMLLDGSERAFSLSVSSEGITIDSPGSYSPVGGENIPFYASPDTPYSTADLKANSMTFNGQNVKYYTFIGKNPEGKTDCFINLLDFALLFDLDLSMQGGTLVIDTGAPFRVDLEDLTSSGFYDEMRGAIVGDATTGEIFAGHRQNLAIPIASTTKLMSYAVIMDAVAAGEIGIHDPVTISANAALLSQGQDRMIPMEEGTVTDVTELLHGMLIASSNECALALAEYVSGSESAFVERMRRKAADIGLSEETTFYNCNGLPVFADAVSTAKMQNHMSAEDMFKLCMHILNVYPQITEITSKKEYPMTSFHMDIKTTNALLYNEPEVIGLKTGTTNMAGSCLVSVMRTADDAGNPHDLVAVVLGAEDNTVRFTSSEILLRYAKGVIRDGQASVSVPGTETIPTDAEGIVRAVLALCQ